MPPNKSIFFNFKAFENIGRTVDRIGNKMGGLKRKLTGLNNKFAVSQKKSEAFRKSLKKMGSSFTRAGKVLTIGVTAPLIALGARFVKVSSDADETANKFKEVFKGVDEAAKTSSVRKLTDEFKLSTRNAQDFLSTTGLIAKGLDLSSEQSLELSTKLASLSQDVASFRNVSGGAAQVVGAFNSALVGERERLKTLGIVITENDVKTKALELAKQGVTFQTIKEAKALSTLAIIQDRTKDDLGDFKRTQKGFSNQLRITAERFDELSKVIGDVLKPVAAKLLNLFNRLQKSFLDLSPRGQRLVVIIAAIAAAMGPLLIAVGSFLALLPFMITGMGALSTASLPITGSILAIAAAVTALIAVGGFLISKWEPIKNFFTSLWDGPLVKSIRFSKVGKMLGSLADKIKRAWNITAAALGKTFDKLLKKIKPVTDMLKKGAKIGGIVLNAGKKLLFGDNQNPFAAESAGSKGQVLGPPAPPTAIAEKIGKSIVRETRNVNDSRVRVDFNNAPRGTQISSKATGIPVELNLGMAGAGG